MKIEWKTNIVDLLTLVVIAVGGVSGYFLIELQNKEQSEAITQLTKIQSGIAEIERANKSKDSELTINKKRINVTLNAAELISEIQPNLDIYLQKEFEYKDKTVHLIWEITNIGKHTVVVDKTSILLAQEVIQPNPEPSVLLKEGVDFSILSRTTIGEIPPGQKTYHYWTIKLKMDREPSRIYHYSKFNAKIHNSISKVTKSFLADYLENEEVNDLTARSFGRSGWLGLKNK